VGDEEEDSIHSGELSRSPGPDRLLGDPDAVESPECLKHTGTNGHPHPQAWSPQHQAYPTSGVPSSRCAQLQAYPTSGMPQCTNHVSTVESALGINHMSMSNGDGKRLAQPHQQPPPSDSNLSSSRLPTNSNQYQGVPLHHLHAYHQQQVQFNNPHGPQQYFHQHPHHHPQIYATTNGNNPNSKFPGGPGKGGSLGSSPNNSMSSSSPVLVSSNGSSPGSNYPKPHHTLPRQLSDAECEIIRKRLYRVGLNLFNKKPEVGISYLVKKKFLEGTSSSVALFLISRKGLSKQMIGEYLANLQSPFSIACLEHFANEIDLSSLPIDLSLRRFQSFLRMPGEAQKIERIMETFSRRYAVCNPHVM